MTDKSQTDLKWLQKAEHWGDWLRFSDHELAEPQRVWMMVGPTGRVRFYEVGKGQVGPEHRHVVAATYWAFSQGFIDPACSIGHNLACRAEVLAGGLVSA